MIYLILTGHEKINDVQTITQVFLPNTHYELAENISNFGFSICSIFDNSMITAKIYENGVLISENSSPFLIEDGNTSEFQRVIKTTIYFAFLDIYDVSVPWGILTGIRPTKIIHEFWSQKKTTLEIKKILSQKYYVTDKKINLAITVAEYEKNILLKNTDNQISLYIGIPFCPSRCLYCSFTSYPIDLYKNKIENYLESLAKEIVSCKEYTNGKEIQTLYIGGGTPTSLNERQLSTLFELINKHIDIKKLSEYTIEAGRPDTISTNKLKIIKQNGVSRISINPQTMNNSTLGVIGRKHTVDDIINAFNCARETGFDNINMDIILGLPSENQKHIEYTLSQIEKLSPDNLTVHTLAVKRASILKEKLEGYTITTSNQLEKMLDITNSFAKKVQLLPYYMYRQKNTVGNFENIGYCKKDKECIYNIQIMEEKQTILALGAGAVTKVIEKENNRLFRIFNVKNVDEYINRIDEMIERKKILIQK